MEQEIARRVAEFMTNLVGQQGAVADCLPEPTGWLVRVEVREAEEQAGDGPAMWVSVYELHLDPLLAVVGCHRRAVRREPLATPGPGPVQVEPPPDPVQKPPPAPADQPAQPSRQVAAEPQGPPPRAPRPVAGPPEARRVNISYRAKGPLER